MKLADAIIKQLTGSAYQWKLSERDHYQNLVKVILREIGNFTVIDWNQLIKVGCGMNQQEVIDLLMVP